MSGRLANPAVMRRLPDLGRLSRRGMLAGSAVLGAALGGSMGVSASAGTNPLPPVPIPPQFPVKEGMAELPDTRLWYWDTGGNGPPVVLLHPATGSALIWGYQQPGLARAGYRVIAYSRRGYYNSAGFDPAKPGIGAVDLRDFLSGLGIERCHLVASAAGGSIATDFALSYPDRVSSLTVNGNSLGVREGAIFQAATAIRPKGWEAMPPEFRELGPSYRAANPAGVAAWLELEHKALLGRDYRQRFAKPITQARLRELKLPVLLIAGAADLITPPSIMRMVAAEIGHAELVIAAEAGHSAYWEEPEFFNASLLRFLAKQAK